MMSPPAIIAFECEFRIESPNVEVTGLAPEKGD
jgi:hypothetical protein